MINQQERLRISWERAEQVGQRQLGLRGGEHGHAYNLCHMSYTEYMSNTLTVRWGRDHAALGERLNKLATATMRPRSYYVMQALSASIDRWEREAALAERVGTLSDQELADELGWEMPTATELAEALAMVE